LAPTADELRALALGRKNEEAEEQMLRTADDYERARQAGGGACKKRSLAMTYGGIRFEIWAGLGRNACMLLIAFPAG